MMTHEHEPNYANGKPICPICANEELERNQNYCQICGYKLEWETKEERKNATN
ncbi:MAG: hypothetical protein ABF969_11980 [Sporolactobacillus sp.]